MECNTAGAALADTNAQSNKLFVLGANGAFSHGALRKL